MSYRPHPYPPLEGRGERVVKPSWRRVNKHPSLWEGMGGGGYPFSAWGITNPPTPCGRITNAPERGGCFIDDIYINTPPQNSKEPPQAPPKEGMFYRRHLYKHPSRSGGAGGGFQGVGFRVTAPADPAPAAPSSQSARASGNASPCRPPSPCGR